ncbi:MAG: AMP-binding protein, partial [Tumebacillaceae bacterium]
MTTKTSKFSTLIELLQWRAGRQGDQVAYTFLLEDGEERFITYAELDQKARNLAAVLQQQHQAGDRALLLYPPSLDYISAFFGCLYAGIIAVPAYPPRANGHLGRLQAIVADSAATIALTT